MLDNIIDTSLLMILVAYIARQLSPDDAPIQWMATVVSTGISALTIGTISTLIKIWT